jgi:hypothetical protein
MEVDPRYQDCKIYKIVTDKGVYIGHTIQQLTRRTQTHNSPANKCATKLLENGVELDLIEDYPCKNKTEARLREQHYMDLEPNLLNKYRAITEIETVNEQQRERYYKYMENDPDYKKKEYARQRERQLEKIPCPDCNILICRSGMNRHKKRMHSGKSKLLSTNSTGHTYIHRAPYSDGTMMYRYYRMINGDRHQKDGFKTIEEALEYKKKVEEGNSDWRKPSPPQLHNKRPCPICENLISSGNMTTHMKRMHPSSSPPPHPKIPCPICETLICEGSSMTRHIDTMHPHG